jgi:hypothetical protein
MNVQPGDLAFVIGHPCGCGPDPHHGLIVTVGVLQQGWWCNRCASVHLFEPTFRVTGRSASFVRPPYCLKRIPPFGELDGHKSQEPLVNATKALHARMKAEHLRHVPKERV